MALSPFQENLVLQHIPTADKIAYSVWKTATHALDLEELKSIAYEGLVSSAERWFSFCEENNHDPEAVQFFYAYSRLRIRGAIIDFLRHEDWAGRSLRKKSKKLREAGQDHGASIKEMSKISGLSEKEVSQTIHGMSQRPVSLEAEDIDTVVVQSIESSVFVSSLMDVLVGVVNNMDVMSQTVLALHYFEHRELQDIAKIIGITEHRSSELHTKSVIKVRNALERATMGQDISFPQE